MSSIKLRAVVALSGLALVCAAHAQQKEAAAPKKAAAHTNKAAPAHKDPVAADFAKFHELMEEDSPAELFEARGKELWKTKRGPKNVSLEKCDLGLGPGVVKGAYVQPAALLRRRRPGDGCRAAHRLLHGDAAGIRREGTRQEAVQQRTVHARFR